MFEDTRFALQIVQQEKVLKKKKLAGKKKPDREAKKTQVTAKALASQVNKDLTGSVQESRTSTDFSNNIFEYIYS